MAFAPQSTPGRHMGDALIDWDRPLLRFAAKELLNRAI